MEQVIDSDVIPASSTRVRLALRLRTVAFRGFAVILGLGIGLCLAEFGVRALMSKPLVFRILQDPHPEEYPIEWHLCFSENLGGYCSPSPLPSELDSDWLLCRWTDPHSGENPVLDLEQLSETPWSLAYPQYPGGVLHEEYSYMPEPGKYRILGAGDSFAFGWGLPREQTPFSQMEKIFDGQCEILNVARPGLHTDEELQYVRAALAKYDCPLTLVIWYSNDVRFESEQDADNDQREMMRLFPDPPRQLIDHSRLALWIRFPFYNSRRVNWLHDLYDEDENADGLRSYDTVLGEFAHLPGTRVVFVLYPNLEGLEDGYPYQAIHDQVAAMIRRHGMPVLDLAPAFAGQNSQSLWLHPFDPHPNAAANEIAARAIVKWLRREFPNDVPQ